MKSAQIKNYGGIDVIFINDDTPTPELSKEHILVEVSAASLNPIDWKVRQGYLKDFVPLQFPATLGTDFSGRIIEVGEGVHGFKKGDEIYGGASILGMGSGSFAELASVNMKNISIKPKISHVEAASLPLAAVSAYQALIEHIGLKKGQKILIHGGSGGIGTIAIQIAKHLEAYVTSTASQENLDFVKNLGADEVIDYKKEHFEEMLQNYDAVYDTVGGKTFENSFKILKKGGILVSMVEQLNQPLMDRYNVRAISQSTQITTDKLSKISQLVEEKVIKPHVEKVFPLTDVKEAFDYLEKKHPRRKVVLEIKK